MMSRKRCVRRTKGHANQHFSNSDTLAWHRRKNVNYGRPAAQSHHHKNYYILTYALAPTVVFIERGRGEMLDGSHAGHSKAFYYTLSECTCARALQSNRVAAAGEAPRLRSRAPSGFLLRNLHDIFHIVVNCTDYNWRWLSTSFAGSFKNSLKKLPGFKNNARRRNKNVVL